VFSDRSSPRGGDRVKQSKREADHSSAFSAGVKNVEVYLHALALKASGLTKHPTNQKSKDVPW
jgi:hypothetical protein